MPAGVLRALYTWWVITRREHPGGALQACPFSQAKASGPAGPAWSSAKTMTQPALSPFAWVRRALGIGALFVILGWAIGLFGAVSRPWIGMILGAIGLFLFGSAWASSRIGGAGVGAGFIGFIAALGMAIEGHHALVATRAVIVEQPSLASWDPSSDIIALHVGELRHLHRQEGGPGCGAARARAPHPPAPSWPRCSMRACSG